MEWSKYGLWAREIIASTPALKEAVGGSINASCKMLSLLCWQRGFWNCSLTTPRGKRAAIIHLLLKTECNLWPLKVKFSYVFKISNYFAWAYKDANQISIKFYTNPVSSLLEHNNFFLVSLLCYRVLLCAGVDWDSYTCLTLRSGEWIVLFCFICVHKTFVLPIKRSLSNPQVFSALLF